MTNAIKNYSDAVMAYIEAQREETVSKDKLRKARCAMSLAWNEMNAMKQEVLENNLNNL